MNSTGPGRKASSFFSDMINDGFNPGAVLDLSEGGKALIISDLHMGSGRGNDLSHNGPLLAAALERYYLAGDWHLVLNGDIEELCKNSLETLQGQWPDLYRIFDAFASENRLFKTLGNHDAELIFERNYPYPLYNAVRIETGLLPLYVYHGHQSSQLYARHQTLMRAVLRYVLKPIGIRNISSARNPHRRFSVERQAYIFSLENNCISVIGHTHRALFESLGRYDYIKFEIERLCRDYPASAPGERERIAAEVKALRGELGKLRRSERRDILRQSLYGDELPVPCLFNSGHAIGRKGFTAIEADREQISLVYWFPNGGGRKFISRGRYALEKLGETPYRRVVLNREKLDYIKARIELLGD